MNHKTTIKEPSIAYETDYVEDESSKDLTNLIQYENEVILKIERNDQKLPEAEADGTDAEGESVDYVTVFVSNRDDNRGQEDEDEIGQEVEDETMDDQEDSKKYIEIDEQDDDEDDDDGEEEVIPKMVLKKYRNKRQSRDAEKPQAYNCEVCGKVLSNFSSYKYHKQLHSDHTPFLCPECGMGFKTRNAYDGHMITHLESNPNKCNICGKSYRQPASLRSHMLTHTGVKPWVCNICGKGMTQKSGFKKHMLTHTGEKVGHFGTTLDSH